MTVYRTAWRAGRDENAYDHLTEPEAMAHAEELARAGCVAFVYAVEIEEAL